MSHWMQRGIGKRPPPINARAETLADSLMFRGSLATNRCLIPATGFYEWTATSNSTAKIPMHIQLTGGGLFAFAGLWSIWRADGDHVLRSCTIVTRGANAAVAPLHDRMPVILAPEHERAWLGQATPPTVLHELLRGIPASEIAVRPVCSAVNDARYDGPECLAPPPEGAQAALF